MVKTILFCFMFVSIIGCVPTQNSIFGKPRPPNGGIDLSNDNRKAIDSQITTGGGKGLLCTTGPNQIVYSADIYDGFKLFRLKYDEIANDKTQVYNYVINKIADHFWTPQNGSKEQFRATIRSEYITYFENFLRNIRYLSDNQKLKFEEDLISIDVDNSCREVQVASYYSNNIPFVDKLFWDKMSWLGKVSFLLHEKIYNDFKKSNQFNPALVKRFVGYLLSSNGASTFSNDLPEELNKTAYCTTENYSLISYDYTIDNPGQSQSGVKFVFANSTTKQYLFQTSFFISSTNLQTLLDSSKYTEIDSADITAQTFTETIGRVQILKTKSRENPKEYKLKIQFYSASGDAQSDVLDLNCSRY